jgi:hypothetical protein
MRSVDFCVSPERRAGALAVAALVAATGTWLGCSPAAAPADPDSAASEGDARVELDESCKTVAGAAPIVVVGQGQNDYLPLADL